MVGSLVSLATTVALVLAWRLARRPSFGARAASRRAARVRAGGQVLIPVHVERAGAGPQIESRFVSVAWALRTRIYLEVPGRGRELVTPDFWGGEEWGDFDSALEGLIAVDPEDGFAQVALTCADGATLALRVREQDALTLREALSTT